MKNRLVLGLFLFLGLVFLTVLPPHAEAQSVIINNVTTSGTHGNDTASTLYLRPLNNAALGPSYFGSGYPTTSSVTTVNYGRPENSTSGIARANSYLRNTGWGLWRAERQKMMQEKLELLNRIASLEAKMIELEKKIAGMEKK